jgi:hypothetical protein
MRRVGLTRRSKSQMAARSAWLCGVLFATCVCFRVAAAPTEPMIVLSAAQLQFAPQVQGTASQAQPVTVSNIGNAGLLISSITINGENSQQFSETHNCPTAPAALAPNAVCEIQVVFRPEMGGDLSAALSVSDNASGSPQSVALRGYANVPAPQVRLSPTVLAFGTQHVGATSRTQVIVLKNTGSAPLNINSAIRIDGAEGSEFRLQPVHQACPDATGELAPNATCSIGIVFAPVSAGAKNAQLVIEDDATGSPHTVELSGSGA